jgi:hypothetical protein
LTFRHSPKNRIRSSVAGGGGLSGEDALVPCGDHRQRNGRPRALELLAAGLAVQEDEVEALVHPPLERRARPSTS